MYIYKMPGKNRKQLVEILSVHDRWQELGQVHLNYNPVDMERFRQQQYKPGGNSADALLEHWGSKNHTVLELFKKLKDMEHYQAMEVIKDLVDAKYHDLINYNNSSFGPRGGPSPSKVRHQPLPPPVKYTQAGAANATNIDVPDEKTTLPLKKVNLSPQASSSENQQLNVEDWDAKKPTRVGRQSSTILSHVDGASCLDPNQKDLIANMPFEELQQCCNGFDKKIGSGGFGEVYLGTLAGQEIAVKKIKKDVTVTLSKQDPNFNKFILQFFTELKAMHTYTSPHILRLLKISFDDSFATEPCLVYEYMPNGSVFKQLYQRDKSKKPLTCDERLNIAVGTAQGLYWLHKHEIVHGK